jgi:hypothetical protein
MTTLFAAAGFVMRADWHQTVGQLPCAMALILASLGTVTALVAGFLGFHLVGIYHVGVSPAPQQNRP